MYIVCTNNILCYKEKYAQLYENKRKYICNLNIRISTVCTIIFICKHFIIGVMVFFRLGQYITVVLSDFFTYIIMPFAYHEISSEHTNTCGCVCA